MPLPFTTSSYLSSTLYRCQDATIISLTQTCNPLQFSQNSAPTTNLHTLKPLKVLG
ncbi:unnamed protein product, partial [Dovyalis caffra]